jgi:predicted nucleotidyltransferase
MDRLIARYLQAVVAALRARLGADLVAVSLVGSGATGDFVPGTSDLDVAAVTARPIQRETKLALAEALSHDRLPVPARLLELVVYTLAALASPQRRVQFELNLNTGRDVEDHVGLEPAAEAGHWFLLDLAIAREHGVALFGPALGVLVGELPREWLLTAAKASLDWYDANEPAPASTVLAACRAWRFAAEGSWGSKADAAAWAAKRLPDPGVPERALALRRGESPRPLVDGEVRLVLGRARAALAAAG